MKHLGVKGCERLGAIAAQRQMAAPRTALGVAAVETIALRPGPGQYEATRILAKQAVCRQNQPGMTEEKLFKASQGSFNKAPKLVEHQEPRVALCGHSTFGRRPSRSCPSSPSWRRLARLSVSIIYYVYQLELAGFRPELGQLPLYRTQRGVGRPIRLLTSARSDSELRCQLPHYTSQPALGT